MNTDDLHLETKMVQSELNKEQGVINKPIYQSTTFEYETAEKLEKVFNNQAQGYVYSRINNPTNNALEKQMVNLEEGIGAVTTSSGMAAISTALLALVEQGDEIVAGSSLFGGTYNFLAQDLAQFGISTQFVESTNLEAYQKAISENTKLIFVETIGNPGLDVPDISGIAQIAHQNDLPLFVDNTLMTPYLFQPKNAGADVVIYSSSKYINGSSNSLGGIIVDLGTFDWPNTNFNSLNNYFQYGKYCYLAKIRQQTFRHLGTCASPFNSFLNSLGLGTLGLRMEKHCSNALQLARFLQNNSRTKKVCFPGLPDHPDQTVVEKQFGGQGGGILTLELENKEECFSLINQLQLCKNMAHLGDIRTLIIHPGSTIYSNIDQEQKEKLGVSPGMLRVSVGIENIADICNDFSRALSNL